MARLSATERRTALVRAALTVIAREGVHGATTRAIVAEAGMSLASFHYAFRSRDELIGEVVSFVVGDQQRVALASLTAGSDIRSAVHAGLTAYFDLLRENPEREQAMFELLHYSMRTPGLESLPRVQHGRYREMVADVLELGGDGLGVTWARPVDEVARVLVSFTDGLTLAWLSDRDDAAAEALIDVAADTIAALAAVRELHS